MLPLFHLPLPPLPTMTTFLATIYERDDCNSSMDINNGYDHNHRNHRVTPQGEARREAVHPCDRCRKADCD